ncbi:hypothetical protein P8631_13750, partial [Guyparkeria sp. 1SP6A2]|nr:hypothetical protein [Guyparkeria sp. 1SP6A2]
STQTQAAAVANYTCPAGQTLSGTQCVATTTTTTGATPSYGCPSGSTLSGTSCIATSTQAATPVYSCPTDYILSGTMCSFTTTQPVVKSCPITATYNSRTGLCYFPQGGGHGRPAVAPTISCPSGFTLS